MTIIHGVKSFEGVRDRATPMNVDGTTIPSRRWMMSSARKRHGGRGISPCSKYWRSP